MKVAMGAEKICTHCVQSLRSAYSDKTECIMIHQTSSTICSTCSPLHL